MHGHGIRGNSVEVLATAKNQQPKQATQSILKSRHNRFVMRMMSFGHIESGIKSERLNSFEIE